MSRGTTFRAPVPEEYFPMRRIVLLAAGLAAGLAWLFGASTEPARAQTDEKELAGKVRDLLLERCGKCHGSTATADVDVRNYKSFFEKRTDESKLIDTKKLDDSVLWAR